VALSAAYVDGELAERGALSVPSQSEADQAFQKFRELIQSHAILGIDDPKLSEADTRSKLIDPVFREVLDWSESEIRREKPVTSGFVDYVLGIEAAYLLVEAKRTKPRFRLEAPTKPRKLKLDGPHLLGYQKIRGSLEQAQRYASDLGAQVAVLTNGTQFILFRPYLPGRSWTTGIAIAFHDSNDIVQDFALFFRLLARDSVVSGALLDVFEQFEGITETLYTPIQYIHNPDSELVRNPFWSKISKIITPLFTDQAESPASQEEIIQNCYVKTALSDQADRSLDRLLKDLPSKSLVDAGVKHTEASRRSPFAYQFERDVESHRPGTYVLTGGVGSGKTTFLRRFALVVEPVFIKQYCVWVHVDFLTFGSVAAGDADTEILSFVYHQVRKQIELNYPDKIPQQGEEIRALFEEELSRAKKTRLYGIPDGSTEWNQEVGKIVDSLYQSAQSFVSALLKIMRRKGLRLVIVLDNTDQQGEAFQERVFLFAQKLSQEHQALCIVALREERFFAAFRRGIFDAFGDRRFHIGSPELRWVLKERLSYGRKKFAEAARTGSLTLNETELQEIDRLLETLVRSTTQVNANIVRMLACVSNGDMRHALDMFREFVSSGNTDVNKILGIVARSGGYTVPFHEFAKSTILGSRRYFRAGRSHIVNVFKKSAARRASHITGLRILARLHRAEEAASAQGEGFVKTLMLLREYRSSFGNAEDFEEVAGEFIRRGLIESEPPRVAEVAHSASMRISASGSYYWRYLVRAFAYVDLMWVDTPIADSGLAKQLAGMAETSDMAVRFKRVRAFLDFISNQELHELIEVTRRSGPYREALMPQIREQIESEILHISKKTNTPDIGAAE
jgi:hypothetical protein